MATNTKANTTATRAPTDVKPRKVRVFDVGKGIGKSKVVLKGIGKLEVPRSFDDPIWKDRYGMTEAQIIDEAMSSLVIKVQGFSRQGLDPKDLEGSRGPVLELIEVWKYDSKAGKQNRVVVKPVTMDAAKAKELKMSPEQIAYLRSIGVKV